MKESRPERSIGILTSGIRNEAVYVGAEESENPNWPAQDRWPTGTTSNEKAWE